MVYTAEQLLNFMNQFITIAEKKLDPSAKTRNRGDVVFPAESANVKDNKDHFPVTNENQARNAWAQAHKYTEAPPWYKGNLKSLQEAVRRKVHAKYPGIEFEKKKKSSFELENILQKYSQTNPFEEKQIPMTAEDLKKQEEFMSAPPQSASQNKPKAQPNEKLRQVQKDLNALNYAGKDDKPLKDDGVMGPNTQYALNSYVEYNQNRIPKGFESGDGLYTMINRDATGQNKTQAFDHQDTNNILNYMSSFLTQLQGLQNQKQISPQNVGQIISMLQQKTGGLGSLIQYINSNIKDERSSPQEQQLAQQLLAKANKLTNDTNQWYQFLNQVRNPQNVAMPLK